MPRGRVSQPQHYWHFGPDNYLSGGKGWEKSDCPVPCRMLNRIPGLYPLRCQQHTLPIVTTQNISRHLTNVPWEANTPQLRTTSEGNSWLWEAEPGELFGLSQLNTLSLNCWEGVSILQRPSLFLDTSFHLRQVSFSSVFECQVHQALCPVHTSLTNFPFWEKWLMSDPPDIPLLDKSSLQEKFTHFILPQVHILPVVRAGSKSFRKAFEFPYFTMQ